MLDFDSCHGRHRARGDHVEVLEGFGDRFAQAGIETTCPYRFFNRALIIAG